MSGNTAKIDLSKCKVGDKAVTRDGHTMTFKGRRDRMVYPYIFGCSCGRDHNFSQDGRFDSSKENLRDVVKLVLSDEPTPKPKTAKKPRRLENDPEGYDPVFDKRGGYGCSECAFDGVDELCNAGTPCKPKDRLEGRGVHYVKSSSKPVAKNSAAPKIPPGRMRVSDCVGKFLVVEGDKSGGVIDLESLTAVRGPFKSIQAAEKDIRDDAVSAIRGDKGNSLSDLENWGSDCLIVEVKRAVRPVPTVKVGCEIKTIAGGDSNAR